MSHFPGQPLTRRRCTFLAMFPVQSLRQGQHGSRFDCLSVDNHVVVINARNSLSVTLERYAQRPILSHYLAHGRTPETSYS